MKFNDIEKIFSKHKEWDNLKISDFVRLEILIYLAIEIGDSNDAFNLNLLLSGRNLIIKSKQEEYNCNDYMISNARQLLKTMNQSKVVKDILKKYNEEHYKDIRFYDIDENGIIHKATSPTPKFYERREEHYKELLMSAPGENKKKINYVKEIEKHQYYFITNNKEVININFPKDITFRKGIKKKLKKNQLISIPIQDILETAKELDYESNNQFRYRVLSQGKILEHKKGKLEAAKHFNIKDVTNFVGQVGAGKSVFAESLVTSLAKKGYRIVIVEPTVAACNNTSKKFDKMGINAVSLIGKSNKMSHIKSTRGEKGFLDKYDSKQLQTACYISALCKETVKYGEEPCYSIKRRIDDEKAKESNYVCPFYYQCPTTKLDEQYLDANIIVTTISALIHTSKLAERELIFNEVLHNIDLIVVDEAESVLNQLDKIFAPSTKINSYIRANKDLISEHFSADINDKVGREEREFIELLQELNSYLENIWRDIRNTNTGFSNERLKKFTALKLLQTLKEKNEVLITEDKLSDTEWEKLYELTKSDLSNESKTLLEIAFKRNVDLAYKLSLCGCSCSENKKMNRKIEFIIKLIAFEQKYREVSNLVRTSSDLPLTTKQILNQSFLEHQKWMPVALIGNLLTFETKEDDLIITKQYATGRALVLRFPWFRVDEEGNPLGPNVLLMSATSCAPKSLANHINLPVRYIIEAEEYKRNYISKTKFYGPLSSIKVSGIHNEEQRDINLKQLIDDNKEIFLRPLRSKKKILLVVNSYNQAKLVVTKINKMITEANICAQAIALKSDSDYSADKEQLSRSKLTSFDDQILVAPATVIERGHNIVDTFGNSKFDVLMFLVRPMSNPKDYDLHNQKINGYIMNTFENSEYHSNIATFKNMITEAHILRTKLTSNEYGLSNLPKELQGDVTATLFVMLVQVFGRLCRISEEENVKHYPLEVYFLDGAFHSTTKNGYDLLKELVKYLEELMTNKENGDIAKTLYDPIYQGLRGVVNCE